MKKYPIGVESFQSNGEYACFIWSDPCFRNLSENRLSRPPNFIFPLIRQDKNNCYT
jgi:hypothetical protein